jgi:hypothetical protein
MKIYGLNWRVLNREKTKAKRNKTYEDNSEEEKLRQRQYQKNNPDIKRNSLLKNKYGITLDQYNKILSGQNGLCAICNQPEKVIYPKTGKIKGLSVDHDGKLEKMTGEMKIRGLLCCNCNRAIGLFQDNVEFLENAAKYLKNSKKACKIT